MHEQEIDPNLLAEKTIISALKTMEYKELGGLLEENVAILKSAVLGNKISVEEIKRAAFYVAEIVKIIETKS